MIVTRLADTSLVSDQFYAFGPYRFTVLLFFFLMIRRPPRSTQSRSSAASDVYKRQLYVYLLLLPLAFLGKIGICLSYCVEHLSFYFDIPCLLYTSPSPRDSWASRMPSSAWKKKQKIHTYRYNSPWLYIPYNLYKISTKSDFHSPSSLVW